MFIFFLLGLGAVLNFLLPAIPVLRWFSLTQVAILRPVSAETTPASLSIVIPARDEEGSLPDMVRDLSRVLTKENVPHEIVVVDDVSQDSTWLVLQALQAEIPTLSPIQNLGNHGFGCAVVCGLDHSKGDACVITRQGFALMGELNPQVTKQLRVLATSPQLVPHMTCFRAGFDPSLKEQIFATLTEANTSTAGKQLMTIFQCDRVEERPLSRLESTRELVAACARLRSKTGGPESSQNPPIAGQPGGAGQ